MKRLYHYTLAVAVFTVATTANYWLWQHEKHNAALSQRSNLDFSLREITSNIEQRMASYRQILQGIQGLYATSDRIEPQVLQSYVAALQLDADYAGLRDISVIDSPLRPGKSGSAAHPVLQAAMDTARDSGHLTMTGKLPPQTSSAPDAPTGDVIIVLPLYKRGMQTANIAERRASFLGWVVAPVRMNELMASLYAQRAAATEIKIHDGVQMSPATLMFNSTSTDDTQATSAVELTEYLVMAGRTWAVTVRPRSDAESLSGKDSSQLIAWGGGCLTILLTLLAWTLVTSRRRALAAAREMTVELREIKERFELIFDTSPDLVMVARRRDGIVVDTNKQFSVFTGFGRDELVGQRVQDIQLWADPQEHAVFVQEINDKGACENFEMHFLTKDGTPRVGLISGKQFQINNEPHVITIARDISDRKEIELRMTHMAQHDSLTGLPNRALFFDRVHQALASAKRNQTRLGLMFIDLDHFKPVNDTFGHAIGDLLLQDVAQRVMQCVRQSDTVGRIGGDEFIVLLPSIRDEQDALLVALKIRDALELPFVFPSGQSVQISCSAGIAVYPEHGENQIELSKSADAAMYLAKERGRNRVEIFTIPADPHSTPP